MEAISQKSHDILKNTVFSISTAESCTGGNIAHEITLISGSSNYFFGSVVCYSNSIKENILNVSPLDIEKFGVVSETIAKQMALGVRNLMKTNYALSTTGIAGPSGGTEKIPVGTVWIGWSSEKCNTAHKFEFSGDRKSVINQATQEAFKLLIKELKKDLKNSN